MKYALIGCGRIAVNHIKAVVNNEIELVAVCDIVPEHIDVLFKKTAYNKTVERYVDYQVMIAKHPELDLVAIATDSGEHAEIALYCINHGLNTIIEKPIAMSMADADRIVDAAIANDVRVAVCHQNRFNVAVQDLRKAIDADRFGRLSHGSINVRWNRSKEYYDQASWRGKWASDGGCLMNQCIHGIDLLRWLFGGEVVEVYGQTRQCLHDYLEAEDVGMALIKFKNGVIATVEGTVNVYPENLEETLYMFGENGTVKLGGKSCNTIEEWRFSDEQNDDSNKAGFAEPTSNVYGNGHSSLYSEMLCAIKDHRSPYVDAKAGRDALEIVLAIYKSQKDGVPIKLPLVEFSSEEMTDYFNSGDI